MIEPIAYSIIQYNAIMTLGKTKNTHRVGALRKKLLVLSYNIFFIYIHFV